MTLAKSQSIQLVWFIPSTEGVKADVLFEAIFDEDPANVQKNKVPSPANPFLSVASGAVSKFMAQVQVQPGRVDLVLSGLPNGNDSSLPLLDTAESVAAIEDRLSAAADALPICLRVALVGNLHAPTASAVEASKKIIDQIGINLPFSDFSDFSFQLNRRKTINGIELNRLVRFSVAAFQQFMITVNNGNSMPVTLEEHGAALAIDINTVPNGAIIDSQRQITIYKAMFGEFLRIGENGTLKALES